MTEPHDTHVCAECGVEFTVSFADEPAVAVTVNDQNVVVLRDTMLDIGADHEGHALRVVREDPDDIGPGYWCLVCTDDDEGEPLLDFDALEAARP